MAHDDPVEFLSSILAAVPWFVTRIDTDYRITYLNRLPPGLDLSAVVGVDVFDFIEPEHHVVARAGFDKVLADGQLHRYESRARGENGGVADYVNYVTPITKGGTRLGLCIVGVDVTEERERERSLRESEAKLQLALAASQIGIWHWDIKADKLEWSPQMLDICGTDQPIPLPQFVEQLVHPDDRQAVLDAGDKMMASGNVVQSSSRILVRGDTRFVLSVGQSSFDEDGQLASLTGGLLDITEQRRTEEQLYQAQKMEAIGQLTTGVAHNFNNILMTVMPTLEMLERRVDDESKKLVDDALFVSRRAADMVRQLMGFAGQPSATRHTPIRLDAIAQDVVRICERTMERHLQLAFNRDGAVLVLGDSGEMTQVVMNLVLNARDAVVSGGSSKPIIEVSVEHDAATGSAILRVIDNGSGIPDAVRERLFEPFFTTKGERGSGMGLATCAAIVERHRGRIECSSSDAGSVFRVTLPIAEPREIAPAAAPTDDVETGETPVRVLVVDDEKMIRRTLQRAFDVYDWVSATCVESAAATRELLTTTTDFDVVLLDRSLPGTPGAQFLPELRHSLPDAKILFFTGEPVPDEELSNVDGVVSKPMSVPGLLAAIREAML